MEELCQIVSLSTAGFSEWNTSDSLAAKGWNGDWNPQDLDIKGDPRRHGRSRPAILNNPSTGTRGDFLP
jgi:hypothetical protein